jgi:sulfofructose kinase
VNLDHAEMIAGARTQIAYILIDARNGERTVIWDRDARLAYNEDEAPIKLAARCRVLHMDAHDPPACASMAVAAHNAGAVVSLDVDNVYDGIELLLPHVDVLISSSVFPQRLTGITDPMTALREISAKYGCTVTGMTTGERGALVLFADQVVAAQAFVVPGGCRDTTGAGDAFHAGFILGLLRNAELEDCLRMGNAVAALKCRNLGARTGLPAALELDEFLASNPDHLRV